MGSRVHLVRINGSTLRIKYFNQGAVQFSENIYESTFLEASLKKMISHEHQCIFIHIPKTAGTSLEKALGHFKELKRGVQDHRPISAVEPVTVHELAQTFFRGDVFLLRRQLKKAIQDKRTRFDRDYKNYFKFTFVRNPWARVFSWYKNVMRDDVHKKRFNVHEKCTFKTFLHHHMDQFELNPQMFWILDKKNQNPMDFIGRFENLEKDFRFVAEKISLKDCSLPKLVVGSGDSYIDHYDAKMKDIVFRRYSEEIKMFHYEYGR